MSTGDKILIAFLVIFLAGMTTFLSYNIAHNKGYEQGIWHARIYYEATGEFPSKDWVVQNEGKKFNYHQEILDTLKPYQP